MIVHVLLNIVARSWSIYEEYQLQETVLDLLKEDAKDEVSL